MNGSMNEKSMPIDSIFDAQEWKAHKTIMAIITKKEATYGEILMAYTQKEPLRVENAQKIAKLRKNLKNEYATSRESTKEIDSLNLQIMNLKKRAAEKHNEHLSQITLMKSKYNEELSGYKVSEHRLGEENVHLKLDLITAKEKLDGHKKEMDKLREDFKNEWEKKLIEKQSEYQRQITDMQNKFDGEISGYKAKMHNLTEDNVRLEGHKTKIMMEMDKSREDFKKELEKKLIEQKQEMEKQKIVKLRGLDNQMTTEMNTKLRALDNLKTKEMSEKLCELRDELYTTKKEVDAQKDKLQKVELEKESEKTRLNALVERNLKLKNELKVLKAQNATEKQTLERKCISLEAEKNAAYDQGKAEMKLEMNRVYAEKCNNIIDSVQRLIRCNETPDSDGPVSKRRKSSDIRIGTLLESTPTAMNTSGFFALAEVSTNARHGEDEAVAQQQIRQQQPSESTPSVSISLESFAEGTINFMTGGTDQSAEQLQQKQQPQLPSIFTQDPSFDDEEQSESARQTDIKVGIIGKYADCMMEQACTNMMNPKKKKSKQLIEPAKSGRAKCWTCHNKIEKGEMREVRSNFYYHVNCYRKLLLSKATPT